MMEVKICGITNLDDARAACDCGADALGFVFFKGSPRFVSPVKAGEIITRLPARVCRVGVFVNEEAAAVHEIHETCGLDIIQIHGDESFEYCRGFSSHRLIRAIRSGASGIVGEFVDWHPRAFLVDSGNHVQFGGTGNPADWEFAKELARRYPVVLAGGLNPQNVGEAIRAVSPAAVDVGSGVESAPGKKDHGKMREFIATARAVATDVSCRGVFKFL
ncbi:MAG: phosphoribosylanthranilate isomerase [Desulfobacteraceae bacterium]|nr:MAG: phosphoribosylanthranilate isomerase [Desulfobacteraceae bacterium]